MTTSRAELFETIIEYPDRVARRRYASLVGLDDVKERLTKETRLLLDPSSLRRWSDEHHGAWIAACDAFVDRPPMFLFAGDVGTGKTVLAESFGDEVARIIKLPVFLYRLSLASRGSGAVGEMTQLLSAAFDEVRRVAQPHGTGGKEIKSAVILLVDEADAIAQSRENSQMHHEDRAGVNALIRGLNSLSEGRLPVIVVLATNRVDAIDPAVRRRAAATFIFDRPEAQRRRAALVSLLGELHLSENELENLVETTGPTNNRDYGFTFSDIYHRLIPAAVIRAFPDSSLTYSLLLDVASQMEPTPPFVEAL